MYVLKEFGPDSGWGLDVQNIQLPLLIRALMREGLCVCVDKALFLDAAAFLNFPQGHTVAHTHTPQQDRIKEVTSCKLFSAHPSFCHNPNRRLLLSLFLSCQSHLEEDLAQKHEGFTYGICVSVDADFSSRKIVH